MKSLFITFEGIEGCGKSTQANLLNTFLLEEGMEVLMTREPGGPVISEKIRHLLLDPAHHMMLPETEILLYMASRSQHTGEWIIPALKDSKMVICDRYYDSTYAYQGAARAISEDSIIMLNHFATFMLKPDMTFLIDIPVEESRERIKHKTLDRLESEPTGFHQKVREGFLTLAEKNSDRVYKIDGMDSVENIHEKIKKIVLDKIGGIK